MKNKIPILIFSPHGGYKIPPEIEESCILKPFDFFIEADSCANKIFDLPETFSNIILNNISKVFLNPTEFNENWETIFSKKTFRNKQIFKEDEFPDELALKNIYKRYYLPIKEKLEEIISQKKIKFIIECHTHMAIGEKNSPDEDMPRPTVILKQIAGKNLSTKINEFQNILTKQFSKEKGIVEEADEKFFLSTNSLKKIYEINNIPVIYLSLSRSLFLNELYFDFETLEVSQSRLDEIKNKVEIGISKFYYKFY